MILCPACMTELSKSGDYYIYNGFSAEYPVKDNIADFLQKSCGGAKRENAEYFFPEEGFDSHFKVEDNNFWFRTRNKMIYTFFQDFASHDDKILEIGCGTGYVSTFLKTKGYSPDCADLFRSALMYCRKRDAGRSYYCYNLYDRIFQNEYDIVCAFDVLEHLDDDQLVFRNIGESLRDEGKLILTVPASQNLWSSVDEHAGHKRRYEPDELLGKLEQAGFKVERMSYFMLTLFPLYLISRFRVKRLDNVSGTKKGKTVNGTINYELNPPRILNLVLYYTLFFEILLLKYVNMPFGSSLICVASKKN